MPLIFITTNLSKDKVPDNFISEFAEEVAHIMKKPIQVVTVAIRTDVQMFRFGSTDPAAVVMVRDLQPFDNPERNKKTSSGIINFVVEGLKLSPNRINTVMLPEDANCIGLGDGSLLSEKQH
ncbi:D-dopachrome decarboxylase-B-like [Apostichopus japonicus]|uniref:D-dopachrome decarboxylase n=1 Tax=Stichopus japonicus TaxID=307972 RepID=A0A5B8WJL5_STIJA|nr:MIF [Apostichopus japonicus]